MIKLHVAVIAKVVLIVAAIGVLVFAAPVGLRLGTRGRKCI